jgi:ketosteroid isomerase-like protein
MKKLIFLAVIAISFSACNNEDKGHGHRRTPAFMDSLRNDLLKNDIAFSDLSKEKGRGAAFLVYAADNATLLKSFSHPLTGKEKIKSLFDAYPDSLYACTWVPISSDVARSGEIGFTYGTYQLDIKKTGEHEAGTYCTVWHKDTANNWKFILDTGNEGLDPTEKEADAKIDAKKKPIKIVGEVHEVIKEQ